ncbi:hypothetical protein ACLOJK_010951 [Asimina triloba]
MGKRKEAWMEDERRSQRRSARLLERGRDGVGDRSDRNLRRCKGADHPPRRCEVSKAPLRRCQVSKATFVAARPFRHCQISEAPCIRYASVFSPCFSILHVGSGDGVFLILSPELTLSFPLCLHSGIPVVQWIGCEAGR